MVYPWFVLSLACFISPGLEMGMLSQRICFFSLHAQMTTTRFVLFLSRPSSHIYKEVETTQHPAPTHIRFYLKTLDSQQHPQRSQQFLQEPLQATITRATTRANSLAESSQERHRPLSRTLIYIFSKIPNMFRNLILLVVFSVLAVNAQVPGPLAASHTIQPVALCVYWEEKIARRYAILEIVQNRLKKTLSNTASVQRN